MKRMPATPPRGALLTAEDLAAMDTGFEDYELWDGELRVMEPVTPYGSMANAELTSQVQQHVRAHDLGWVTDSSGGFIVKRRPDRVLAPDLAFIPKAVFASIPRKGFAEYVPTFVAEVRSPRPSWEKAVTRGGVWLYHGVDVVWVVDPEERRAVELRQDGSAVLRGLEDTLDGTPALPGLKVTLASLFPPRG